MIRWRPRCSSDGCLSESLISMSNPPIARTLGEIYADAVDPKVTADRLHRLELLHRTGLALSAERNRDRLIETILVEAQQLCRADGGTLYLKNDQDELCFAILRNDS